MVKIGGQKTRPNTLVSAASVIGRTLADKVYCSGICMFPSAEHGSSSLPRFHRHEVYSLSSECQSPVLRTSEEFNILLEPRGPDSGIIFKHLSGDCLAKEHAASFSAHH